VLVRLRQLLRRRRSPSPPTIDVGDLAVAQFVHDLRNDLTVIIGCAENISRRVPKGHADEEIAEVRRSADHAAVLARELVKAARPRFANRRPVDLNHVVASAMATVSRCAGEHIRVRLRLSSDPVAVVADAAELERIILNLAFNARDAMPGGGVLTVETAFEDAFARLTVSDTGCGMTSELKARIFEPFFTTKQSGTGLGLNSVAFTVNQLHGEISVESSPGRGTSVTVLIPLAR